MSLRTGDYPNCCTSKVLYAFGGSNAAMYGRENTQTKEQMAAEVKEKMLFSQRQGYGILSAMLTTEQTQAAEVLAGLGWKKAIESNKKNHSDTRLQLWCWACMEEDKRVDVVVTNPFEVKPSRPTVASPQQASGAVNQAGERMLSSYLRPPVNRWIPVEPGAPMIERIRGRVVSVRLGVDDGPNWNQGRVDQRIAMPRAAERWNWTTPSPGSRITHVYIHPL